MNTPKFTPRSRWRLASRAILRAWLPPVAVELLARIRRRAAVPLLRHEPGGWDARKYPGWNVPSVLAHYEEDWAAGEAAIGTAAPLGRLLATDSASGNLLAVSFAYAVAVAAHGRDRVSLLDWGGALGHYRRVAEAAVPGLSVEYSCKDVPVLAEAGGRMHPTAHFFSDDRFSENRYDLVVASGSLQYVERWIPEFYRLAACAGDYLYVARLPTHDQAADYLYSQHAYGSAWLTWSINRTDLLCLAERVGLSLVREFVVADAPSEIADAPAPSWQRSFLFRRLP